MNKKLLVLGVVLGSIVSAGVVHAESTSLDNVRKTSVKVEFANPLTTAEAVDMFKKNKIKATELHYTQDEFQGGYTVRPGETAEDSLKHFNEEYEKFLSVALDQTNAEMKTATDTAKLKRLSGFKDQLDSARTHSRKDGFKIDGIRTDDDTSIDALKKVKSVKSLEEITPVQKVERKVSMGIRDAVAYGMSKIVDFAYASISHESWAPYMGVSTVNKANSYQTFYFNSLSGFTSWTSYEHETQIYDLNYVNYGGFWMSNMPSAYLDSQAFEQNGSILENYTIGTTNPIAFQLNTVYTAYISFTPQSSPTALVRIKGQLGRKTTPYCNGWTWCVLYPLATTGSMSVFTASGNNVFWTY